VNIHSKTVLSMVAGLMLFVLVGFPLITGLTYLCTVVFPYLGYALILAVLIAGICICYKSIFDRYNRNNNESW